MGAEHVQVMSLKRTLEGMTLAGVTLIQQAIDAQRRYHEAQRDGAFPDEVERLRILADSLFQTVTDYQLYAHEHQPVTRH